MLIEHFENLFEFIADHPQHHARETSFYRFIEGLTTPAFHEAKSAFETGQEVLLFEVGPIQLPYKKMGAIDSIDLFGLDELLMFSFYYRNRGRYKYAADIGANLGLHSIVLSLCGLKVESYEPDPEHYAKLIDNLELNNITSCTAHEAAVSDQDGIMKFVRVLGNTSSNHLAGAKANAYGELEHFDVALKEVRAIAGRVDLFKIDAEGHEAVILKGIPIDEWKRVDAFVEIGSPENARLVYDHFSGTGINIFSQKCGWARAESLDSIPFSYKEGSVFISNKPVMPW